MTNSLWFMFDKVEFTRVASCDWVINQAFYT